MCKRWSLLLTEYLEYDYNDLKPQDAEQGFEYVKNTTL